MPDVESSQQAPEQTAGSSGPETPPAADFDLLAFRLEFVAQDSVYFPPGKSGNIVRGAFGSMFRQLVCVDRCHDERTCEQRATCAYARIFEPDKIVLLRDIVIIMVIAFLMLFKVV